MRTSKAIALARQNLGRNRRGALLSAMGVAVGVGCLVFFAALGAGVTRVVKERVLPVDAAALEVVPPAVSMGGLLGGGRLDEAARTRLAALPGVTAALPKMSVKVSAVSRYNGDFFGRPLRMGLEIMAVGVDPHLVAENVAEGRTFGDPGPGKPIPILISTRLLELYNTSFAAQRGLPRLSPDLLTGFRLPIEFGRSFVAAVNTRAVEAQLEVVGFSPRALLGGVTVPLEVARRLNREHGQDDTTYSAVVLRATSPDLLPELAAQVRRMGFDIDDTEQKLSEQVGWGIAVVTAALGLLSALITLLAAVNIAHAFHAAVRERRREIGVLRAVGASSRNVLTVLLAEAAFIGLAGGTMGITTGVLAALGVDAGAAGFLPDFPFKPETYFAFSPALLIGALAVALLAAMGGAFLPARSAAWSDPSVALSD